MSDRRDGRAGRSTLLAAGLLALAAASCSASPAERAPASVDLETTARTPAVAAAGVVVVTTDDVACFGVSATRGLVLSDEHELGLGRDRDAALEAALEQLRDQAVLLGADAVVGSRFAYGAGTAHAKAGFAYGTAVVLEPKGCHDDGSADAASSDDPAAA